MDMLITTATSRDERDRGARVAVLPVGSFEQHGDFLLLITDTIVAGVVARRLSADHGYCCCCHRSRCRAPRSTARSPGPSASAPRP